MLERSAIAAEEQRGRAMGLPRSVYSDAGEFVKCPSVVGVTFPEILGRFQPSPDRDLNLCRGSTNADSDSTALKPEQVLKTRGVLSSITPQPPPSRLQSIAS